MSSHLQAHDVAQLESTQFMDAQGDRPEQCPNFETDGRHGLGNLSRPTLILFLSVSGDPSSQRKIRDDWLQRGEGETEVHRPLDLANLHVEADEDHHVGRRRELEEARVDLQVQQIELEWADAGPGAAEVLQNTLEQLRDQRSDRKST